ncbi:MAG: C-factor [Ponticaulis sp.]|nr:C-factor [Ponticaulis sp.]|tara:strand:- start:18735 stop:19442 length:708 start_codon:yes stop_codon:yes gene_type:complete
MSFEFGGKVNALVIGHSGGIGSAITRVLEGHDETQTVLGLSRSSTPSIDFRNPDSLSKAAEIISEKVGELNCLMISSGILTAPDGTPPEKSFSELDADALSDLLHINTIGPALALKAFLPLMPRRGICRIGVLSARVGSIGDNSMGGWISYRASKAALNQIVRTAAIEQHRKNSDSVCLALHPGTIETPLSEPYARNRFTHSAEDCAQNLMSVVCTAKPDMSGKFYDYDGREIEW